MPSEARRSLGLARRGGSGTGGATAPHFAACSCRVAACRGTTATGACGALIVHPRFAHTLGDQPVACDPPRRREWHDLPPEVLELIGAQLECARDLLSLSSVCRDARLLAGSDTLWRQLCRRRFGVPDHPPSAGPLPKGFWRDLFRFNHQLLMDMVRCSSGSGGPSNAPRFGNGPLVIQMP